MLLNDIDHHKVPVKTRHIVECSRTSKSFSSTPRYNRSQSLVNDKDNKAERPSSDYEGYNKNRRCNSQNEDSTTKATQIQSHDSVDKSNESSAVVAPEIKITFHDSDKDLKSKVNENIAKKLDIKKSNSGKEEKKSEKAKKTAGMLFNVTLVIYALMVTIQLETNV